jgi:hypothetical protein
VTAIQHLRERIDASFVYRGDDSVI